MMSASRSTSGRTSGLCSSITILINDIRIKENEIELVNSGSRAPLRFDDAVAWRRVAAGDISNEKGRILQSAHAEVGGLLLIPDADEEISGSGALKGGGIDEDETIVFINHFDDSDEAWDLGLRRLWSAEGEFRKPGKGCDQERAFGLWFRRFAGAGVRNFFASRRSSRLGRTAANRQCDQDRSQAQAFQLRRHLGEIAANLGALLILATPPSVWQTVLSKRARYSGPRLESDSRTEFNDSQPWQPPAPHPQEGL